jgi:hypothetical protein
MSTVVAQTWINSSSLPIRTTNCCSTGWWTAQAGFTIPNSTFTGATTTGRLLIQATIPVSADTAANVYCQPNINGSWAGSAMGDASFDHISQFANTPSRMNITISRVYPAPPTGTYSFSLACASNNPNVTVMAGGVVSLSVFQLH